MRYIIIAVILGMCVSQAWAKDLSPGDIYMDKYGCEWQVVESSTVETGIRKINGVTQFVLSNNWNEYSFCAHACGGTPEWSRLADMGCYKLAGTQCNNYYKWVRTHEQYFWAVPTGNCQGGKP